MKFSVLFLVAFCAYGVVSDNRLTEWNKWKTKYGKKYSDDDEQRRFQIWEVNYRLVTEHNKKYDKNETTYSMEVNKFAAMTPEEFRAMLLPISSINTQPPANVRSFVPSSSSSVPNSKDWRSTWVTPVKNQGQLGSCYSFSAIQAIEGQYCNQTGKLVSFSEQQIVDCNQGGDGGFPFRVYPYLIDCGGSETEEDYPYVDKVGKCQFSKNKVVARIQSYRFVTPFGDENALKKAVAQVGPISVSEIKVFASFQLYKSGVYYEPKCSGSSSGEGYHAMLATGYGTTGGQDYWMVKNSWGTDWGEDGYIRMIRNRNNNCGIASQSTYPIMAQLQPNYASFEATTQAGHVPTFSIQVIIFTLICLFLQQLF